MTAIEQFRKLVEQRRGRFSDGKNREWTRPESMRDIIQGLELSSSDWTYVVDAFEFALLPATSEEEILECLSCIGSMATLPYNDAMLGNICDCWCELLARKDGLTTMLDRLAGKWDEKSPLDYFVDEALDKARRGSFDREYDFAQKLFQQWSDEQTVGRAVAVLDFLARVRHAPASLDITHVPFVRTIAFSRLFIEQKMTLAAPLLREKYGDDWRVFLDLVFFT